MDYENDIIIDDSALDVEWLNQPLLAMKYGRYWAECYQRVMQCEEAIKIVKAELVEKANSNPDRYLGAGVKPTAPNVEAYYRNHESHKAAKKDLQDATFELNIADIAKREISTTRKAALENLVRLHAANYFAGPNVPRDLSFEAQKKTKQNNSNSQVARGLKRNK